jgi:predicted nucleic acid-binding protein
MGDGLLDTNHFVHALARDALSLECRTFLDRLKQGLTRAYLDPLVVHELPYSLPRVHQQMSRSDVATYILGVLAWPGIVGETHLLREAIDRWDQTPGLGFVDAYLAARARQESVPVYTKNVRELSMQGAVVPDPLPGSSAT